MDHLSNGRVGWNIVTSHSNSAAQAMGKEEVMPHDERYLAAEEYMEIVYRYILNAPHRGLANRSGSGSNPGKTEHRYGKKNPKWPTIRYIPNSPHKGLADESGQNPQSQFRRKVFQNERLSPNSPFAAKNAVAVPSRFFKSWDRIRRKTRRGNLLCKPNHRIV